ncbi:sigma-70 family RNA polymerase sigma factor [Rhodoferax sp.]|uniref:RNA polymerase sigma factor n=1 Tax=Rhodoferax sp. TaxID=50421 RepID=UPI0026063936|nr:sigma-70 family RNA polymerase sigma factor [Rhodoferax sp.]MDD2923583.1 sigma-70 family RNA polymerase sigma factor [Rhodoferax sp.]
MNRDAPSELASDDERWVALAQAGDIQAYGQLALAHQTKLYRFVLKYVKSVADARDITQEALLQGYRCIGSFNGHSRFSTWLTGIALNLARNHVNRAPAAQFEEYADDGLAAGLHSQGDPVRALEDRQALQAMSAALATLPGDMRDCIVLVGMEGLSYEEAAQALAMPVGSVKSKVSRARQRLREFMSVAEPVI